MKYDLLIIGGNVLDPGARLKGRMDIGIKGGKIVDTSPSLDAKEATKIIDVNGAIVTPGLVDIHAHIFVNGWDMGEHTDQFCRISGVTTLCDGGSAGSATFAGLRHMINKSVRTRTKAFVNLSALGIMAHDRGGELIHPAYADPEGCARTVIENRDLAMGVKLRFSYGMVWDYTTEPLRFARKAADIAGVPMMVHITDTPLPLPQILEYMKPGDIVTHCLHGHANGIMGPDKLLILKEVREAQRNGIIFDCAHGKNGHFNFPLIRKSLDQGFLPDTISSDLSYSGATRGPVFDLPTTMSKLMHFGVSIDDVVLRATTIPARILGAEDTLGTLRLGANADLAAFELQEGEFEFRDTDGNVVIGHKRLRAMLTLRDGRVCFDREGDRTAV